MSAKVKTHRFVGSHGCKGLDHPSICSGAFCPDSASTPVADSCRAGSGARVTLTLMSNSLEPLLAFCSSL